MSTYYLCINDDTRLNKTKDGWDCPTCGCHTIAPEEDGMSANYEETLPDEIAIKWHIEDVQGMEGYEDLKDDEARQVLYLAQRNHDATIGINWDVLEIWADQVREGRK